MLVERESEEINVREKVEKKMERESSGKIERERREIKWREKVVIKYKK